MSIFDNRLWSGKGLPAGRFGARVAGLSMALIWVATGLVLTWDRTGRESFGVQGDLPLHYHLVRTMVRALRDGEWWSPWAGLLNGGRGGDFFRFYPPLFYWLSGAISLLPGVGIIGALKLMTVLTVSFNQLGVYVSSAGPTRRLLASMRPGGPACAWLFGRLAG